MIDSIADSYCNSGNIFAYMDNDTHSEFTPPTLFDQSNLIGTLKSSNQ